MNLCACCSSRSIASHEQPTSASLKAMDTEVLSIERVRDLVLSSRRSEVTIVARHDLCPVDDSCRLMRSQPAGAQTPSTAAQRRLRALQHRTQRRLRQLGRS